jgi:hypothetical protein
MTRFLAIAALFGFCAAFLTPTPASAVCDCYNRGHYKRCEPSLASCKASGGDRCYEGCRTNGGPG